MFHLADANVYENENESSEDYELHLSFRGSEDKSDWNSDFDDISSPCLKYDAIPSVLMQNQWTKACKRSEDKESILFADVQ